MRAAIYCRISKDVAGQAAGVGRQEQDCRAFCEQRGWEIAEVYIDNSRSAYDRRKVRPAYRRMMTDVRAGQVGAVVVWHLDRLYRHPTELEEIIELVEASTITVATVTGGDYDLTTTDGRAMARVVVAFARKEVEDKSRRHVRMHQQLADEGRWQGGGTRPYGYSCSKADRCTLAGCAHDRGHSLIPAEADHIRSAAKLVLDGASLRSICSTWNTEGVGTVTGGKWTTHVLRRILTAPHTAGLRAHKGAVIREGQWPAILDRKDSMRLSAILNDPARRKNELGGARRYLLAGFLVCGRCGTRMVARPRSDKRRAYVCASGPGFGGCGRMGVLAEPLEAEVAKVLAEWVDVPAVERGIARAQEDTSEQAILDAIQADEAELEQWAVDAVEQRVTRGQMLAATQRLNARVEAARRQLVRRHDDRAAAAWDGQGGALRAAWGAWSLDKQRATLGTYVDSITLGPAVRGLNRFDRDRLLPERGGGIGWRR